MILHKYLKKQETIKSILNSKLSIYSNYYNYPRPISFDYTSMYEHRMLSSNSSSKCSTGFDALIDYNRYKDKALKKKIKNIHEFKELFSKYHIFTYYALNKKFHIQFFNGEKIVCSYFSPPASAFKLVINSEVYYFSDVPILNKDDYQLIIGELTYFVSDFNIFENILKLNLITQGE